MNQLVDFLKDNNSQNSIFARDLAKLLISQKKSTVSDNLEGKVSKLIYDTGIELSPIEKLFLKEESTELSLLINRSCYVKSKSTYILMSVEIISNLIDFLDRSEEEHKEWVEYCFPEGTDLSSLLNKLEIE